jgi:hypothetical protein
MLTQTGAPRPCHGIPKQGAQQLLLLLLRAAWHLQQPPEDPLTQQMPPKQVLPLQQQAHMRQLGLPLCCWQH